MVATENRFVHEIDTYQPTHRNRSLQMNQTLTKIPTGKDLREQNETIDAGKRWRRCRIEGHTRGRMEDANTYPLSRRRHLPRPAPPWGTLGPGPSPKPIGKLPRTGAAGERRRIGRARGAPTQRTVRRWNQRERGSPAESAAAAARLTEGTVRTKRPQLRARDSKKKRFDWTGCNKQRQDETKGGPMVLQDSRADWGRTADDLADGQFHFQLAVI